MEEIWKDIPGYEGVYQASNLGRIRTAEGKTTYTKFHGQRKWTQRVLKPKACRDFNACGYRVSLWKDGKHKDFLVARLVCTTWHENLIDTKMTVNHKDGNRLNNHIDNLEWLSLGDNIRHGFEHGLYKQDKTILTSVSTGEKFEFRSKSEASKFLRRNPGYLNCLVQNKREYATSPDGEKYTYHVIKPES